MREGFTVWLTGLSGSGKSTLAARLRDVLESSGYRTEILDGDEVRSSLSRELGYSRSDRECHARRIGFVANLLARNRVVAIVACIAPYRDFRRAVRNEHTAPFVEVFVDCPLSVVQARDTKGLYAKAAAGDLTNLTGVSDPYESPLFPDIHLHTQRETIEVSLQRLLDGLALRGVIAAGAWDEVVENRPTSAGLG